MNAVTSLLDFILNLLRAPQAQAQFRADPERMLAEHGLTGVRAGDIHEALPLVTDHRAVQLDGSAPAAATPPPVQPAAGESETHAAIRYLNYITNTYTYTDDHITTIDDSVHQNIWASGNVTQTFDDSNVVAMGHGAVAAGGGIDGTVTTGSGDTVANGTGSVAGNGDTVANGTHDVQGAGNVQGQIGGSPGAPASGAPVGGLASGSWSSDSGNTDLHNYGSGATNAIGNENPSSMATNWGDNSDSGHDGSGSSFSDGGSWQHDSDFGDAGNSSNWPESHTVAGSYDDNGTHADHSGLLGGSYTAGGADDTYGTHDAAMELYLH
jgi:hypothetical protein